MLSLEPCAIHMSYVQCPKEECNDLTCKHREPHYPIPYNSGSASVSCRCGDDECPGCKPVSNTILVELMNSCHLCQQHEEEEV